MIIDVFVAEREAKQTLDEEAPQGMLAATGIAVISEAGCQMPGQADVPVDGPQARSSRVPPSEDIRPPSKRHALSDGPAWGDRL
ncbi:MAG: hypothetical protein OXB98_17365 [Bryobacterales bacterium]|nr:hypothetical protein [Bryobacterales bacterium]